MELAHNLKDGLPIATPVFDGAKESEVKDFLNLLIFLNQDNLHYMMEERVKI